MSASFQFLIAARRMPLLSTAAGLLLLGTIIQAARADIIGATENTRGHETPDTAAKVTVTNSKEEDQSKGDSERLNDSYQPKGIELGQFLILPKVEVDETYNSNVYASDTNVRGDFLGILRSVLQARSRFDEHELNLRLLGEQYFYSTYQHDNRTDLEADIEGRYDFSANTKANLFTQIYSRHEERGGPDDAHGVEPTPTQGISNILSIKHQSGRFTLTGGLEADRLSFGNVETSTGTWVINSDRDRVELTGRERGSYEMFPGYAAVLEISENTHMFDHSHDQFGYDHDSSGYRVESGIGIDVSQLIKGDFLVGYFQQYYQDQRFTNPSGISARATFNWTPTKVTIVIPSFDRTVNDTTAMGASAMVRNALSVTVRHELRRNIILTGYGSVSYDQYTGISHENAMTYETSGKIIYAFTPELFVGGEIKYMNKQSELQSSSYDQLTTMVRLGLQY